MGFFDKNVGNADRTVRLVLAYVLVGVGVFLLVPPLNYAAFVLAIILAFTAATRFCGAYPLLGINTLGKAAAQKPAKARKK